MADFAVESAVEFGIEWHKEDHATTGRDGAVKALENADVVFDMFEHVETDNGVHLELSQHFIIARIEQVQSRNSDVREVSPFLLQFFEIGLSIVSHEDIGSLLEEF